MLAKLIESSNSLPVMYATGNELSVERNLNYNKSSFVRKNNVVNINIDKLVNDVSGNEKTKSYSQNLIKKYELTGNKEVCIRKIFIAERTDNLFDITVRELKIYYRKNKKHQFNKVLRFKTVHGNIEHVFEILKDQDRQKTLTLKQEYLLN